MMKNLLNTYGILGIFQLIYFRVRTKILFRNARIIRFPIRIRGKKFISIDKGFVTGFNCRLDVYSNDNTIRLKIGKNVQINDYVHIGAINSIEIEDISRAILNLVYNNALYKDLITEGDKQINTFLTSEERAKKYL